MPLFTRTVRPSAGSWIGVLLLLAASSVNADEIFVHTATASNTFLHLTQIDHPLINGDPNAFILLQQVYNPAGDLDGTDNPAEIGLAYSPSSQRWSIENQDLSAMPIGSRYFLFVAEFGGTIVHENTMANTDGSRTVIDSDQANGLPSGRWVATWVRTRTGASGGFNDHPISVEYDATESRWVIVNQDMGTMPSSGGFHLEGRASAAAARITVQVYSSTDHVTTVDNTSGSLTRLASPALLGAPYSAVFATLDTTSTPDNPHPLGVAYDFFEGAWAIVNLDGAAMPVGVQFGVLYVPALFWDGFESGDLSGWSGGS